MLNTRLLSFVLLILFVLLTILVASDPAGLNTNHPSGLYIIFETAGTVLALTVGLFSIIRYYAKRESMMFFVSVGFLGGFVLNAVHIVVTSTSLIDDIPSNAYEITTWSWLMKRLFLSFFLMYGLLREKILRPANRAQRIHEIRTFIISGSVLLILFILYAKFELPVVYNPNAYINRPLELIPGFLFLGALIGYFRNNNWNRDYFEYSLVMFLIINTIIQFFVISTSDKLYDDMFYLTSGLRIVSYLILFSGLIGSSFLLFRQVETAKNTLSANNEILVNTQSQLKSALDLAERSLRTKDQFLAHASHEIRNPLNGIIGLSNVLENTRLDADQKKYLDAMRESADTLMAVINNILDHSKLEAGKMMIDTVPFSMQELLYSIRDIMQIRAEEKNIWLNVHLSPECPAVVAGDPVRLKQVLLNLCDNAIKFTSVGGVQITASPLYIDKNKVTVRFTVTDSGMGIAQEKQKVIFDDFTQADTGIARKYGGSGLGLSIVYKLVGLMNGEISFNSIVGKGSTFIVDIPLEISDDKAIEKSTGAPQLINENNSAILLVDDNAINQMLTKVILEDFGFRVFVAGNGKEGIELLLREKIDLVLMDVQMPVMDGYQATQKIRNDKSLKAYAGIPVIGLTAYSTKSEIEKCFATGMNDYILKPFNPRDLYKKIIQHIEGSAQTFEISDKRVDAEPENKHVSYIDFTALNHLSRNNPDIKKEMIEIFTGQLQKGLDTLKKSVLENNMKSAHSVSHMLKSSCSIMGVTDLQREFQQIETLSREEKIHDVSDRVKFIEPMIIKILEVLQREIEKTA